MPAIPVKKMLETLLKTATLSAKEREAFEGMWDSVHRYGSLSRKQTGWIEEVYYKKDLAKAVRPPPQKSSKMGHITDKTVTQTIRVRSLASLKMLCPHIEQDSPQYTIIRKFFASGGEVLEVRPHNKA